MKYFNLFILLFTYSCSIHKIQNTTANRYTCEFEISGISETTYRNDLLPRLNKLSKNNNLIYSDQINLQVDDSTSFKYLLFLDKEKITNISEYVSYFKIFTAEAFEFGSIFKLCFYEEDKSKMLIYQYSKSSQINLFSKKDFILLKSYLYKIK